MIPLMRDYAQDSDLFELVLRLLVNLTNPEILLFREELPEDKLTRNYYLQLQRIRQDYKRAFVDELLWQRNQEKMMKILEVDPADRSEEHQFTIERILILLRNILQVRSRRMAFVAVSFKMLTYRYPRMRRASKEWMMISAFMTKFYGCCTNLAWPNFCCSWPHRARKVSFAFMWSKLFP